MTTQEKIELAVMLARRSKASRSHVSDAVAKIARCAATLTKWAEKACNEPTDYDEHDRIEARQVKTVSKALEDLKISFVALETNRDPRGYSLFIVFRGEDIGDYTNDMGKRVYGIG